MSAWVAVTRVKVRGSVQEFCKQLSSHVITAVARRRWLAGTRMLPTTASEEEERGRRSSCRRLLGKIVLRGGRRGGKTLVSTENLF